MDYDLTVILDNISSPIFALKPICDKNRKIYDFTIIYKNKSFLRITNELKSELKFWSDLEEFTNNDFPYFQMAVDIINGHSYSNINYHSVNTHEWYKLEFNYVKSEGILIVQLNNISNEKRYYEHLKDTLTKDTLTGLLNRAAFSETLEQCTEDSINNNTALGVLILDIDNLKNINDSSGEKEGDNLIIQVADLLQQFSNQHIKVFRYGDDEFSVIIHDLASVDTVINIIDTIYESFEMDQIEVSGGVSLLPDHTTQKEELIRFADMAIHYAKKNGRNNIVYFEPEMQRIFIQHLTLQNKITNAIVDSNFSQVYQPQFDIRTGELRGFEALIRWKDKDLGEIAPSVFIPLAEETSLILPIGRWVFKTAMATLKLWKKEFNFNGIISINVSPIQLRQEEFLSELQSLIEEYGISPDNLEIEITEGVFINNMNDTVEVLDSIKQMGIRLSLDDFGTGYSSLSYLQKMPLSTLKIDKTFINDITAQDGVQANITQSIISMVKKMGLETIAEGVENKEQLELLKDFNCTSVQGFLRGKPMSKELCNAYLGGNKEALLKI